MKKKSVRIVLVFSIFISSITFGQSYEETLFIKLLNNVRSDPAAYGKDKLNIDLSYIRPSRPLKYSKRLSETALKWARVIESKNKPFYLFHSGSDYPNGESLHTNNFSTSGDIAFTALDEFLIDRNVPSLGHRHHLLSHENRYKSDKEIGIAIIYSKMRTWIVVVHTDANPIDEDRWNNLVNYIISKRK